MRQATPLLITAHACLRHRLEPQMIIYFTVNGRHYRVNKATGSLPDVLKFERVDQMIVDAKAIAAASHYYDYITRAEKMPFTRDDIMRLVLGLSRLNMIEIGTERHEQSVKTGS